LIHLLQQIRRQRDSDSLGGHATSMTQSMIILKLAHCLFPGVSDVGGQSDIISTRP
jgi:hypothetical protein